MAIQSKSVAAVWGLVGFAVCAAMTPLEISLLEEGLIIHLAERMQAGERLFSDLVSFTGPFPFELLALLFRIFGSEIEVARMAIAVAAGSSCGVTFAIARRAGIGPLAHAAAALAASTPIFFFPLHSLYFYSAIAYHLVLLATYAAIRATSEMRWAWIAGVLAALAALTKQSVGGLLCVGLPIAIWACSDIGSRWRRLSATVGGGFVVAALAFLYYGANREILPLVESLVLLPLQFETVFRTPFINLWPLGAFSESLRTQALFYTPFIYSTLRDDLFAPTAWSVVFGMQILYSLPFVALAGTALRRMAGPLPSASLIHLVAVVALISNLFPRTDWGHLVYVALPAIVQLLLLLPHGVRSSLRLRGRVAASLILATATSSLYLGASLWQISGEPEFGPRVRQRPVAALYKDPALARVIAYLEDHAGEGESIYVARAEPLVYFATRTRNPTRYSGIVPGRFEAQQAEILSALEDVRFVVMSEIDQPVYTYYRDLLPEVAVYLERYFSLPEAFADDHYGWLIVLERNGDRGATAIDLFTERPEARPWILDKDAREMPAESDAPRIATSHNRRPLSILLGALGGGIDYSIRLPAEARFEAGIGLREIRGRRISQPPGLTMSVLVSTGAEFVRLFERPVLVDALEGGDWQSIEVDLSAYGNQDVVLRLEVRSSFRMRTGLAAWWGSPRVVGAERVASASDPID